MESNLEISVLKIGRQNILGKILEHCVLFGFDMKKWTKSENSTNNVTEGHGS